MINRPASLDTIVATNLHADILSDLAAALAGSLGIAPTANIDPERRYPSMFEPIHGSAFDIMGKGLANPVGTFWSVVMLLEHLGESQAAAQLMEAIEQVTANPELHTRDLGGSATTAQVTQAVCQPAQGGPEAGARRLSHDTTHRQGRETTRCDFIPAVLLTARRASALRPSRRSPRLAEPSRSPWSFRSRRAAPPTFSLAPWPTSWARPSGRP